MNGFEFLIAVLQLSLGLVRNELGPAGSSSDQSFYFNVPRKNDRREEIAPVQTIRLEGDSK